MGAAAGIWVVGHAALRAANTAALRASSLDVSDTPGALGARCVVAVAPLDEADEAALRRAVARGVPAVVLNDPSRAVASRVSVGGPMSAGRVVTLDCAILRPDDLDWLRLVVGMVPADVLAGWARMAWGARARALEAAVCNAATDGGAPARELAAALRRDLEGLQLLLGLALGTVMARPTRAAAADLVAEGLRLAVAEGGLAPSVHIDPPGLTLETDPEWCARLIAELVCNAVQMSPSGGRIALTVRERPRLGVVDISVADEGVGMPADPSTAGLGFLLASRLAAALGGSVRVASSPGQGAVVTASLPRPAVAGAEGPEGPGEYQAPLCAAVIDDNPENVLLVTRYLESRGWRVDAFTNPIAALAALEEHPPAVLILDIQMPFMDGYEVARRIRAHPSHRLRTLPILALSALGAAEVRRLSLEAGCDEHLEKPSRLQIIEATSRQLAQLRRP